MSKESLRKKFIKIRKSKFVNQNINFNEFKKILHTFRMKKIKNIGGYYPINSEIGCLNILEKLEKNNFKISLPITKKDNNMDFYQWSFNDPLKVSYRGIPEPAKKKKVYPDILIVPLVAFDRALFCNGEIIISPKSFAPPSLLIITKSIIFLNPGSDPPKNIPLVADPPPAG